MSLIIAVVPIEAIVENEKTAVSEEMMIDDVEMTIEDRATEIRTTETMTEEAMMTIVDRTATEIPTTETMTGEAMMTIADPIAMTEDQTVVKTLEIIKAASKNDQKDFITIE